MPRSIPEENQRHFVERLEAYLTKSGRKRVELARACHWDASMVSKLLKLQARPNLAAFHKFMAPFLVAHGGIAHARQVTEMAELLGGELDEADLVAVARAVENFKDPEQDTLYFRERAEGFRKTIPDALNRTKNDAEATSKRAEALEITAEPATVETAEAGDDPGATPAPGDMQVQPSESAAEVMTAAIAKWQSVLREVANPVPVETLDPDEVIAAVLEWENRQADPVIASMVWDWLGSKETFEKLRQPARLEFVLQACDGQKTWNQLEWQWLNHMLTETARRHTGQAQLSPSQLLSFVVDLGQVAFEAVKAHDENAADLAVNLADLAGRLPIIQAADWRWLQNVTQAGLLRLSVSTDGVCRFESCEEAEFLAAQYLLNGTDDKTLVGIARNCGRPFGVLRQAVRSLHFAGRDEAAGKLVNELLRVSEVISMRQADAAHLLAACEAPNSAILKPIWDAVEWPLCQSWAEIPAPEYRAYIARVFCGQDSHSFRQVIHQALQTEWLTGRHTESILRSLAIGGGLAAVEMLRSLAETRIAASGADDPQEVPWNPLSAVLAVTPELAPSEQVVLLEGLALSDADHDDQWRAVSTLAKSGSIPAMRALERIAVGAQDAKLGRYAETQRELLGSPAHLALVAGELDAPMLGNEPPVVLPRVMTATALLVRAVNVTPTVAASRVLSRSLARLWANPNLSDDIRVQAAIGLRAARAWPALEICLEMLPLADQSDDRQLGWLLPQLASPAASPLLWQLVDRAASPAQRVVLIRCLGRAGGMALDKRFEQLLAGPSEPVAIAAVAALAESLGPAAARRLAQIAVDDGRPATQMAANEGLAEIGSERALSYLREKLRDASQHASACFQLARMHSLDAEALLVEAAQAAADESIRSRLYWPALAMSGGATAVQALRDFLGADPDELELSRVRAELATDTVARAPVVWSRLANDPSPAWRMTAAAILVQDPTLTLIEGVVRMAVEDPVWPVRSFAQRLLQRDVPAIAPAAVAEYVLDQFERTLAAYGILDVFLLCLTGKCLRGLATVNGGLPAEIARRVLTVLGAVLVRAHPGDDYFVPLLAALAFPEFWEAAGELERRLDTVSDATTQMQILDTLIAMQAPTLPDVVIRQAGLGRWPALQARATDYLVENADYNGLAQVPNELKHVAYRVAVRNGIRIQGSGFRHKVILANGATYGRQAP